jgi:hypothetical protein
MAIRRTLIRAVPLGMIYLGIALSPSYVPAADPSAQAAQTARPAVPPPPPVIKAVRVEKAPALDGFLDDDAWKSAAPFSGFKMVFPDTGSEPSERTELRVVFDASDLYIGVMCFDREPAKIAANTMAHDTAEEYDEANDDTIAVIIDPFQDKRNAYLFIVNPRGARSEGLAFGESSSLNWDGIWGAKSRILADGWSTEMRIPFKTISFDPGLAAWGINVQRNIPRKLETIRLSGIRRDAFFNNAAEAALLEGVSGIKQGLGLTFRPYGFVSALRESESSAGGSGAAEWALDGGFDLYKNITPNFVGAFSYNTDFAETESDERRLNLTRFSLYFPEKRAFFLEGSEIFNFAGRSADGDSAFVPFFSRRIGLFGGERIPVSFGAKFYGKLGDTNIALLDVGTRAFSLAGGGGDEDEAGPALALGRRNFIAGRISQNLWEESKVGVIFTDGSAEGTKNTLAGFDFVYQTSRFLGGRNFNAAVWAVQNWNEIKGGKHHGFGFRLDYPNDLWNVVTSYGYYGDALAPGMGFLPRPAVQNWNFDASFSPRPEGGFIGDLVRQFEFSSEMSFYWDLAGRLETRRIELKPLSFETESSEYFEFGVHSTRDVLPYDFEISDGVVLPKGAYDYTNCAVQIGTAGYRPWSIHTGVSFGPFYSGHYTNVEFSLDLKLKGYATLSLNTNFVRGNLPEGKFSENVYEMKADVFLSPDLGLMSYIQYDDVSKNLGANLRLRWRVSPGNEIFLVYTKNWERRWDPMSRFVPLGERGVFKISLSLRP